MLVLSKATNGSQRNMRRLKVRRGKTMIRLLTAQLWNVIEKCEIAIVFAEANDQKDALDFMV